MTAYETVLQEATQLPVEQRVQLIDALWETVPEEAAMALSQEWLDEIEFRSAEDDAGRMEHYSWDDVRKAARRKVGLDDSH
jgi:putative addiction module component (TIGR02574 family)